MYISVFSHRCLQSQEFNYTGKKKIPKLKANGSSLTLLHLYFQKCTMKIPHLSWLFWTPLFQLMLCVLAFGQCLDSQRSLLLQLKESLTFNSSSSTKLVQWNQTTGDCCNWQGVTCNKTSGHVIGLDLENEAITSEIKSSSTLFKLQSLERLNLAFNSFNETEIPAGLSNLTSLVYLNLSNSFSGQVPNVFLHMEKLVVLDLSYSYSLKIENPSLSIIVQNLTQLAELYLDTVNMSSQASEWSLAISSSLPNLRILSLADCHITGPIDPSFGKLQFLSVINLNANNLNVPFPESFVNLSTLTELSLHSCNLSGVFPQRILQKFTLKTLQLSYNGMLEVILPELPQNGSLQTLILTFTKFSGMLPESIGNMGLLSRLDITDCKYSGTFPNSMVNLTRLVHLDFSHNNLSGHIPLLQNSKNLTYFDLSHNRLSGTIPSTYFKGLENLVYVDLEFNMFNGKIPSSLFSLKSLQWIKLSHNQFSGFLPDFSNASRSQLHTLEIDNNNLNGSIPLSWFQLKWLNVLSLSFNQLTGLLRLETIHKLGTLTTLDLSYNNLSIETSGNSSSDTLIPQYTTFRLASCKLRSFPYLGNQSRLYALDLSDNQIGGAIPSWTWNLGNGDLMYINFSRNQLVSLQEPYTFPRLSVLDLHSNQLTGKIPVPPETASYVDYAANNFSSSISLDIGKNLTVAYFFSVSSNKLTGTIPDSICEAVYLHVLDLSNNGFQGVIPPCLLGKIKSLAVLNFGNNNFTGHINGTFVENCLLKTLDLHGNHIEGHVPESLSNCTMLEVLNLGNNHISDTFPCFITRASNLRVLVLRFNNFYGNTLCSGPRNHWPNLQIIDIASNQFTGKVPDNWFVNWTGMMDSKDNARLEFNHLRYKVFELNALYYEDTITVTNKGLEVELEKILTIFTSIDISCNHFEGNIPETMGKLKSLYLLNLSHNALTGSIPSSIGNMKQLEALDFSVNKLSGRIPMELANLTFISYLNLSYNELTGRIPTAAQFSTFEEGSFRGNKGLCGKLLNISCVESEGKPPSGSKIDQSSSDKIDWEKIFAEIGFSFGLCIVVIPLLFCKRWRIFYYEHVDHALSEIFRMYLSQ